MFGDSVPTFRDPAELGELVRYYLARPDLRREMAGAARHYAQPHTFDARARQMLADWPEVLAPEGVLAAFG